MSEYLLEIVQKRVDWFPWKDVYMSLLLAVNEDFDDDMLQEAIELLIGL